MVLWDICCEKFGGSSKTSFGNVIIKSWLNNLWNKGIIQEQFSCVNNLTNILNAKVYMDRQEIDGYMSMGVCIDVFTESRQTAEWIWM